MTSKSDLDPFSYLSRWRRARHAAIYREFYERMRDKFTFALSRLS